MSQSRDKLKFCPFCKERLLDNVVRGEVEACSIRCLDATLVRDALDPSEPLLIMEVDGVKHDLRMPRVDPDSVTAADVARAITAQIPGLTATIDDTGAMIVSQSKSAQLSKVSGGRLPHRTRLITERS